MRILVTGGSGSGKSAWAEKVTAGLAADGSRGIYIATMRAQGQEAARRIERHRRQRAGLGFCTLECPDTLAPAKDHINKPGLIVLLDDTGNLVANALFDDFGTMEDPDAVCNRLTNEIVGLANCAEHCVVVTNEVGSAGPSPYAQTNVWIHLMGTLNCRLAAGFDTVVEVVAGVPQLLKGRLP